MGLELSVFVAGDMFHPEPVDGPSGGSLRVESGHCGAADAFGLFGDIVNHPLFHAEASCTDGYDCSENDEGLLEICRRIVVAVDVNDNGTNMAPIHSFR